MAASERLSKALEQRKLGLFLSTSTKQSSSDKVIIVPAKLSEPDLGLNTDMYNQIANEATVIMHVAWAVNFLVGLRSFVPDHISSLRNMLTLALHASRPDPPRFAFCSSVASVSNIDLRETIPEWTVTEPSSASPLRYSQSKWVAERICQRAHEITRLRGRIAVFRVGQLSGDSRTGIWNEKETWPMMLSSVKAIGSLPDLTNEALTWLPVDVAAQALVEATAAMRRPGSGDEKMPVYHIVNDDHSVTWADLLGWLRKLEDFDTVEPRLWVERLQKLEGEGKQHPALKLLSH